MLQVNIPELKRGDKIILKNITFSSRSRIICLKGRNGSGKTSLLLALSGLIHHNGKVKADPEIKNIGLYAEDEEFYGHITAKDFLKIIFWFKGEVNDIFRIDYNGKIKNLSTGQRKKLYLTLALSGRHDWLLLDEPFANLDEKSVIVLREYLKNITNPIILTTQTQDELCGEYVNVEEFTP
ncbi:ABC transporter ATP-binding protein [Sulfurisphaera ohwakuensis]|uniref:ABC-type multidrug transport system ATPase subunit n=1 Tax=Sulfurisphaera ohwakuensis TaxID=69656 RepID=A0A650CF59_SULOH|nr:ATP-binding cassette domain-containing protein [Sulfurisphaera ohwakuensis]MBB5255096.1 ABC-type multidrug transport system ATPase subunit [Sulfurisphaera ohwakuensis]QGR16480.1 ATP-binding cassette domain-containing protein [Sulfurisphaera ohwakuensis]